MLNFRNINLLFIAVLVMLVIVDVGSDMPFYVYIIAAIIYSLILFWGSYNVSSNFYFHVICEGRTKEKQIAISFDDGPAREYTPHILQILKEENVPAAFFCIGKRVAQNESLLKQVYDAGHIVGNHSYSHATWFDLYTSGRMYQDLKATDAIIQKVIGVKPKLFRPPYGVTNPNLAKAVIKGNYIPVGWNIRSLDTVITDHQRLLLKVTKALKPGAVVLFHDTGKAIQSVLPAFIELARQEGYEFVRLDKLLKLEPYA